MKTAQAWGTRRPRAAVTVCGSFVFLGVGLVLFGAAESRPNLLLVTIDTLRPDRLSCYGAKVPQTPRIDAVAARGVLFTRAFAHNPETLPSHANILLGTTPLQHGVHDNAHARVAEDALTLAEHLKASGYATAAFVGAFPLDARFGLAQGFDLYDDFFPVRPSAEFAYAERPAEAVVLAALAWLAERRSPWFCWVHLWDPHAPYRPPEPYGQRFKDDPYSGEVAYVDDELGGLLGSLERPGEKAGTFVVLTADHGESLGEHGELTHSYFAYNSTLWVPLIVAGPGLGPRRVAAPVGHADIFPTICDLLDLVPPSGLQGRSLAAALEGKELAPRPLYFESLGPYLNRGWAPLRGLVDGGRKYMDSPLPEVYDIGADFGETKNLASQADLARLAARLKKMTEDLSAGGRSPVRQAVDAETLERLRSLGYVVSSGLRAKDRWGPEDDLKTLLPFQQKLDRAIQLGDQGRLDASAELLGGVIRGRPEFAEAYSYLSYLYRSRGRPDDALRLMAEAADANPANPALLSSYGLLLVKQARYDRAVEVLTRAVALRPDDVEAWDQLGIACWRTKRYDRASEAYALALALDPSNALVISNVGALFFSTAVERESRADLERSIARFEEAVRLDPTLTLAYRGLGVALRAAGRLEEAIITWEKGLALVPDDDFFLINLGAAHLDAGNKARARDLLEKCLALGGGSLSAEEKMRLEGLLKRARDDR